MAVNIAGVISLIVFYTIFLAIGIWTAATRRKKTLPRGQNEMILGNHGLGIFLAVFTLIATWIGGGFMNGTAEAMFARGLAWCQVPVGYSLSLLFGAALFVRPMRKAEHVTMLDPFQERYGAGVGGLLFLPSLCGDLLWCGAVFRAFGSSLAVIAGVEANIGICTSAILAAVHSMLGGFYSVGCADALQLACIALGLAITAPFAVLHPAVSLERNLPSRVWLGEIRNEDLAVWVDGMLLLVLGGIPWQSYFQRILSLPSTTIAMSMSVASMFGCITLALPAAIIGIVARATDWSLVEGYNRTFFMEHGSTTVLPVVLRYLTPQWVAFLGLGAIAAAVMSSADSSILASSSMFSRNVYRLTIRPKATERELEWVLRISIIVISVLSASVALTVGSVYYLSYLCSDLIYVVLFPQLLAVVHWPSMVDTYGCLAGYFVAITLRIAGGERGVGIPPFVEYPFYDATTQTQKFPFRTMAMMASLFTQLATSFLTRNLLGKGYFPRCCDVLAVYSPGKSKNQPGGVVQSSSGAALMDSSSVNKSTSGMESCDGGCGYEEDGNPYTSMMEHRGDLRSNVSVPMDASGLDCPRNPTLPRPNAVLQTPRSVHQTPKAGYCSTGQILGVRNLRGQVVLPGEHVIGSPTATIGRGNPLVTPLATPVATPYAKALCEATTPALTKTCERLGTLERSAMELNLNQEAVYPNAGAKAKMKGVKLVGMDGATLRRPSLQGTFSPTPSVELVHILDRRQSSSSYGPGSLSPVPMGLEACKTHGTATEGQSGSETCRIKRGIVRHHSFNETGDRALTTLARQPAYPSMPLRAEDCRMTLARKDRRSTPIIRPSSAANEKELTGYPTGLVVCSPTYGMYSSAVKNANYFVADDEAVSRF